MHYKASLSLSLAILTGSIAPASAHDIVPGITGFPELMLHPFFYTTQLIAIFVAILCAARTRPIAITWIAVCFAGASICAQAMRIDHISLLYSYWLGTLISLFAVATLVAILPELRPGMSVLLVAPLGGVVGLGTRGDGSALYDQIQAGLASSISSMLAIMAAAWLLWRARADWGEILLRVVAAWIAASTAMIVALALKA